MLANRAHSIIVQSRLAISLAWVAGYVNTAAVLTCGVVTSHLTGHASNLGRDVALRAWSDAALMAALIGSFFLGALISGFALELGRQRGWVSIYVLPAAIEFVLLAAFAVGVRMHDTATPEVGGTLWWMTAVAALAMGVQNATITRISSGVVRTTHLTGIVTDLGHESAQLAVMRRLMGRGLRLAEGKSRGPSAQRLLLLSSILVSFIVGSASAAWIYYEFPRWSMLAPLVLLAWIIIADLRTPICEIEEAIVAELEGAPSRRTGIAVFRAIPRGGDSRGEAHLPDLTRLLERAGDDRRAVVVDLSNAHAFGPLAANAVHGMLRAAEQSGHRVVFAGLDDGERATINALSRADLLTDANSAPTLAGALEIAERSASAR
ncbi:MAG: hypothetical protein RLY21_2683 [Planctomycetota bacterium]|jgi:uncharacterized membrane protein YoaK (UPF0700 family)